MRKSAQKVIAEVAHANGILVSVMMYSPSKKRSLAWPRQQAMFEVYLQCPHLSYPAIGAAFGGMDHTTVMHGVKQHCKRSGFDYETIRRTRPKTVTADKVVVFRGVPATAEAYRIATRIRRRPALVGRQPIC